MHWCRIRGYQERSSLISAHIAEMERTWRQRRVDKLNECDGPTRSSAVICFFMCEECQRSNPSLGLGRTCTMLDVGCLSLRTVLPEQKGCSCIGSLIDHLLYSWRYMRKQILGLSKNCRRMTSLTVPRRKKRQKKNRQTTRSSGWQ